LSPGPGLPDEAGDLMSFLADSAGRIPIFGVCLGMQAMAIYLGGELYNQESVKHGVQITVDCTESVLFGHSSIEVGLYHSWAIREGGDYVVTAKSKDNVIMAIENMDRLMFGVQFHPESIMTPEGFQIIRKFINLSSQTNLKTI
jgi:anthranilate synthase component 2